MVPRSSSTNPVLGQENSPGVPTSSIIPGHSCVTLFCSGHRETAHTGAIHQGDLGPRSGINALDGGALIYVDAPYEVHGGGTSHSGSCVVIGDVGAVQCWSTKQDIVVKSSTEEELVAVSNSANRGLHTRQYKIEPKNLYPDDLPCMVMLARGRSSTERTWHLAIRHYWTKDRVNNGEMKIIHEGT
jgi:hypothetical protein